MYTLATWDAAVEPYTTGPFRELWPKGTAEFRRAWVWQSTWQPTICRACDTTHDHRREPSVWIRIRRYLSEAATRLCMWIERRRRDYA